MFIRDIMNCSSFVPKDLLYLELAIIPIRYIIQTRRLLYLHHILQQDIGSLLYRFFAAQLENPTRKDWVSQILDDLEELEIDFELEEIQRMSKEKYKKIVKHSVEKKAFLYLKEKKENRKSEHSKGKLLEYNYFEMAEYLCPQEENISIEEQKWLFKCRVEDMNIKGNNRWKYQISCLSCNKNIDETQSHILHCSELIGKNKNIIYIPSYNELYTGDILEQVYVSNILLENFNRRVTAIQPM